LCYTTTRDRGQTGHWKNVLTEEEEERRHIGVGGSPRGHITPILIIHV